MKAKATQARANEPLQIATKQVSGPSPTPLAEVAWGCQYPSGTEKRVFYTRGLCITRVAIGTAPHRSLPGPLGPGVSGASGSRTPRFPKERLRLRVWGSRSPRPRETLFGLFRGSGPEGPSRLLCAKQGSLESLNLITHDQLQSRKPQNPNQNGPKIPARRTNLPCGRGWKKYPQNTNFGVF